MESNILNQNTKNNAGTKPHGIVMMFRGLTSIRRKACVSGMQVAGLCPGKTYIDSVCPKTLISSLDLSRNLVIYFSKLLHFKTSSAFNLDVFASATGNICCVLADTR